MASKLSGVESQSKVDKPAGQPQAITRYGDVFPIDLEVDGMDPEIDPFSSELASTPAMPTTETGGKEQEKSSQNTENFLDMAPELGRPKEHNLRGNRKGLV